MAKVSGAGHTLKQANPPKKQIHQQEDCRQREKNKHFFQLAGHKHWDLKSKSRWSRRA